MNTVYYDVASGRIASFVSGVGSAPSNGTKLIYTEKALSDLRDLVVLNNELLPRISLEFATSALSSIEEKELFWKGYRTRLLQESDYMLLPDVGDADFKALAIEYRQRLRDLPTHRNWPNLVLSDLPNKPAINRIQTTTF